MKCPIIFVRVEVVGKDMSAYDSSTWCRYISEPSPLKRVRKIRRVGETVDINDNELERARPRHLLENTADCNQRTNTARCLSQDRRHQTNARIFMDLSHDASLLGLRAVISFG